MIQLLTLLLCTFFGTLPSEVYLDEQRPIDRQEEYTVEEKLPNGLVEPQQKIAFEALPSEVKEVIHLETGERYLNSRFMLWVTLGSDPADPGRSVKIYIYTPLEYDEAFGNEALAEREGWWFSRQDGKLKLR